MMLHKAAREFYTLSIVTDPPVTAWEASFDSGTTWTAGVAGTVDSAPVTRWLVAGPDAVPGDATVLTSPSSVTPLIRAIDSPEIVVRTATGITVSR